MAINPSSVGKKTQTFELEYDWQTLALYALGIGATENELDYLYEKRGPKVYPSFAVVPAYPVLGALIGLTEGPYSMVVHSGQTVEVRRQLPPSGKLTSWGEIKGIYDLKRMALAVFRSVTELEGEVVYESEWQIIFRGEGGFGGERRPKSKLPILPKREPDWQFEETIGKTQALLYRLSGDHNPLHADPEFAREVGFDAGPILHGLCSFGYVCRAATLNAANGDASKITRLTAQFKKPVWPGETLTTQGFREGNSVIMQSYASGADNIVVGGCAAELA